ncbi:MAG: hypothetical protein DRN40_07880 [Thermoplasmata archaeon]|nr:MAG: hypothetical protein DRN40_07880 [Thermoplasmata archaeon]
MEKNVREMAAEEYLRWKAYIRSGPGVLEGEGRRKFRSGLWRRDGVDLTLLLGERAEELEGDGAFTTARARVRVGRLIKREEEHIILRSVKPTEKLLELVEERFPHFHLPSSLPVERHLLPLHMILNLPPAQGLGLGGEGSMPSAEELLRAPEGAGGGEDWRAAYLRRSDEAFRAGRWRIRDFRGVFLFLLKSKEEESERLLRSEDFLSFVRKGLHPLLKGAFERAAASPGNARETLFKELATTPLSRLMLKDALKAAVGSRKGKGLEDFLLSLPDGVLLPVLSGKLFSMEREERLWFIDILGRRGSPEARDLLEKFQLYSMDRRERARAEEALRRIEGE